MKPRTYLAVLALLSISAGSAFAQGKGTVRDHRAPKQTVSRDHRAPVQTPVPARRARVQTPVPARRAPVQTPVPARRFDVRTPLVPKPPITRGPVWEREQEMSRTRSKRRAASIAATRARWQAAFLASARVKQELRIHARRIAKLDRMSRLAGRNSRANARIILRINAAINKENTRHDRTMSRLEASFQLG